MISRSRRELLLVLSTLGLVNIDLSQAQITSNATCFPSFSFLFNNKGQSPCLVAAYLGGTCNGGQFGVIALDPGGTYAVPTVSSLDPCQCSTVMYSMVGACSACQNGTIITWTAWAAACSDIYVGRFTEDIPSETEVPAWAYANVTTTNIFNPQVAMENTTQDTSTTNSQSTQTDNSKAGPSTIYSQSTQVGASAPLPTNGSGSSSGSISSTKRKANTGAIVGGVMGGTALLAVIAVFIYVRKFKRQHVVFWSGSVGSRSQDVNTLMMEADPYILETATRGDISGPDEDPHLEKRRMMPKSLVIRSKLERETSFDPNADMFSDTETIVEVDSESPMSESPASASEYESRFVYRTSNFIRVHTDGHSYVTV